VATFGWPAQSRLVKTQSAKGRKPPPASDWDMATAHPTVKQSSPSWIHASPAQGVGQMLADSSRRQVSAPPTKAQTTKIQPETAETGEPIAAFLSQVSVKVRRHPGTTKKKKGLSPV
jgi:hypothetical protein